ncbi:MarR family winged helix-turn-helix transcriptional regulator [Paenibacillus sp. HJGM_3]|uniref:MarR family winged helix-turn-helix transcriptional regulator n=1 Tax=Paenibacillus sp. HJGM_3 TaxID=3379816 RepID=UPI00385EB6E3
MQPLFDLILKTGLRPFAFLTETAHLEQKVTRSDLSTLLILLFRGDMTMSGLAAEMGAPLSSMTSIAKRLEQKGYIARAASAQDQRVKLVTLTQEGRQLAEESQRIIQSMLSQIGEALSPEELEQFTALLLKVARVLQDHDPSIPPEKKAETRKIIIEE